MKVQRLEALARVSQIMLDMRLAELRAAAAACTATRSTLAEVSLPRAAPENNLAPAALSRAGMLYDRWAEARRAEINLTLARQTAIWLESRDAAAMAFGRDRTLARLTAGAIAAQQKRR